MTNEYLEDEVLINKQLFDEIVLNSMTDKQLAFVMAVVYDKELQELVDRVADERFGEC